MAATARRRRTRAYDALGRFAVLGCETNTAFLRRLTADPDFAAARLHTGFLGRASATRRRAADDCRPGDQADRGGCAFDRAPTRDAADAVPEIVQRHGRVEELMIAGSPLETLRVRNDRAGPAETYFVGAGDRRADVSCLVPAAGDGAMPRRRGRRFSARQCPAVRAARPLADRNRDRSACLQGGAPASQGGAARGQSDRASDQPALRAGSGDHRHAQGAAGHHLSRRSAPHHRGGARLRRHRVVRRDQCAACAQGHRGGADGLICVGGGAGGHASSQSAFSLVREVREFWDGCLVLGGSISDGHQIRAAEVLGADLAYMGTRFIATQGVAGAGRLQTDDRRLQASRTSSIPTASPACSPISCCRRSRATASIRKHCRKNRRT